MDFFPEAFSPSAPSIYAADIARESIAMHSEIGRDVETAGPEVCVSTDGARVSQPLFYVNTSKRISRWSDYMEDQFQILVGMRASGLLTKDDRSRLNWLRSERQRTKSPIGAAQILKDFQARELRMKAIDAMSAYVKFIESPSSSKEA